MGRYRVEVAKECYCAAPSAPADIEVSLEKTQSPPRLTFLLARPGDLYGRVIDRETDRPVQGLRVIAAQRKYFRGRPLPRAAQSAVTDAAGRFVVRGLGPGGSRWR